MLVIGAAARRTRLGVRHRLASSARAAGPAEVAQSLVALHSTDAPSVYLAALARMAGGSLADVDRALYEERSLVRVMGMRRTVFVVPREMVPVVIAACGQQVAARERKALEAMVEGAGVTERPRAFLEEAEEAALAALAGSDGVKAAEVATRHPNLDTTLVFNIGRQYQGKQKVASRMLTLLAAEGRIVRARPAGSWRSSQYRWASMERWLGHPLQEIPAEEAQVDLARLWLHAFGPATVHDFAWWAGLTVTAARRAVGRLETVEVDLDGTPGVVLQGDAEPVPDPEPWVAMLPTLDSTPMGWRERGWYLGGYGPRLFDGAGNISPTIWRNGRIVGAWAQGSEGDIRFELLEDVGSEAEEHVARAAHALSVLIGPVRLAPRARGMSPAERELSR